MSLDGDSSPIHSVADPKVCPVASQVDPFTLPPFHHRGGELRSGRLDSLASGMGVRRPGITEAMLLLVVCLAAGDLAGGLLSSRERLGCRSRHTLVVIGGLRRAPMVPGVGPAERVFVHVKERPKTVPA
jgi:hypothetical protein